MPKTVDTRRYCKIGSRACNNPLQPHPYISIFGIVEDCCTLSTLLCNTFLCLHLLTRCHPYFRFYTRIHRHILWENKHDVLVNVSWVYTIYMHCACVLSCVLICDCALNRVVSPLADCGSSIAWKGPQETAPLQRR